MKTLEAHVPDCPEWLQAKFHYAAASFAESKGIQKWKWFDNRRLPFPEELLMMHLLLTRQHRGLYRQYSNC